MDTFVGFESRVDGQSESAGRHRGRLSATRRGRRLASATPRLVRRRAGLRRACSLVGRRDDRRSGSTDHRAECHRHAPRGAGGGFGGVLAGGRRPAVEHEPYRHVLPGLAGVAVSDRARSDRGPGSRANGSVRPFPHGGLSGIGTRVLAAGFLRPARRAALQSGAQANLPACGLGSRGGGGGRRSRSLPLCRDVRLVSRRRGDRAAVEGRSGQARCGALRPHRTTMAPSTAHRFSPARRPCLRLHGSADEPRDASTSRRCRPQRVRSDRWGASLGRLAATCLRRFVAKLAARPRYAASPRPSGGAGRRPERQIAALTPARKRASSGPSGGRPRQAERR